MANHFSIGAIIRDRRGHRISFVRHAMGYLTVQLPMWITQDGPSVNGPVRMPVFSGAKYDPLVMDYGYLRLNTDFNT